MQIFKNNHPRLYLFLKKKISEKIEFISFCCFYESRNCNSSTINLFSYLPNVSNELENQASRSQVLAEWSSDFQNHLKKLNSMV
jgi:hypothetical protein